MTSTVAVIDTNFISEETKAILERGNYSKARTEVPNNHPALKNDYDNLKAIATALGIDFEVTEFTVTVSKTSTGVNIYLPYVGQHDGEACIFWGKVRKPINSLSTPLSIKADSKRATIEFELEFDFLALALMLPKENKADEATLKRALKQKKLAEYLAKPFTAPIKLRDVEPGTYTAIGYNTHEFPDGTVVYNLLVKELGSVKCNTALKNRLESQPVITEDLPAIFTVLESTSKTSQGHPIIPVTLVTSAAMDLPQYDF